MIGRIVFLGYYMYAVTANSNRVDQIARLVSPLMKPTDGQCLSFWYHSSGDDAGRMLVSKRIESTNDTYPIWSIKYNFGNVWNAGQVTISQTNEPWTFIFDAITTDGYIGYAAIDDVTLRDGACPTAASCNFENVDFCTWHNVHSPLDDFDWLLGHGETDSAFTGPSIDHTYNDMFGYYAFIEASWPRVKGDHAMLESTILLPTQSAGSCFSFWYHMYGEIGALNVYIQSVKSNVPLWIW